MEESFLEVVRLDEVAMKYGVSCEICGDQVALRFGGLEVRVINEGGSYVALIQLPLPKDFLDDYLAGEYLERYCIFLRVAARGGFVGSLAYELREDVGTVVARVPLGNLGRVVDFVKRFAEFYEEVRGTCQTR